MLCTDRYSALAEDNRILACVVLDSPSLTMGSLQGERALCRNRMNEVPGDITHHPKIKSVWGNQLRLKPQTLHRFFVLQLFFFFPYAFFKLLQSTSSNPKWALCEVLQFRILCWLLQPPHQAQHERAAISTSVHLHKICTETSCETWLTVRFCAFSGAHRKHSQLKHQPGAQKGPWAQRSPGLQDLKQLICPHIPSFSSPTTPHLGQHSCMAAW